MTGADTRMKIIRKRLGFNQSSFSEELNIKQSQLSFIESGKKDITSKLFVRLVEKFNVSADWLITGKGPELIDYTKHSKQYAETTGLIEDLKESEAELKNVTAKLCRVYGIQEELSR